MYPKPGQTVIAGDGASIARYTSQDCTLVFCKECGVSIASEKNIPNAMRGTDAAQDKGASATSNAAATIYGVNARVLHDVDAATQEKLGM